MNIFQKFIRNQLTKYLGAGVQQNRVFISPRKTAGEKVNHDTALTYSAVWRAVMLISQDIAGLPWNIRQKKVDSAGRVITQQLLQHPAASLLTVSPNDEMNAYDFRQTITAHALTWGNGYAEILRDRSGRPAEMWLIEPERGNPTRDQAGNLIYEFSNGAGANTVLDPRNVFHLKGPSFNGLFGYSVIGYAARSIGVGMATEQFGADLFANGAFPSMVIKHPNQLSPVANDNLRKSIADQIGKGNHHMPFVLEEGATPEQWTIPPEDAQFLETRKFNVAEVARWYGVPLHKLQEMDRQTFNNIEQQNIDYVTGSLLSWIRRSENEANIKLISPQMRSSVQTKLNMNGLLRGDTASRGTWYTTMSNLGVMTVNEVRELEDMNPIGEEGDKHLVQLNLTTLDKVGEEQQNASPDPNQETPPTLDEPEDDEEIDEGAENSPAFTILGDAVSKALSREHARITDALENKKTLEQFTKYLDRFSKDQAKYLKANIETPINAFGLVLDLDGFIADQMQSMRIKAVNCFTEKTDYDLCDTADVMAELMARIK